MESKSEKAAEAKSKKQSDAAPAQADTAENTTRRDRTAAKDKAHEAVDLLATLDLDALRRKAIARSVSRVAAFTMSLMVRN